MPLLAELPKTFPISDLRTNLAEIEAAAHESSQPIILTRNGTGSLVVMGADAYNEQLRHQRAVAKLREAEIEAHYTRERFDLKQVQQRMDALLVAIEDSSSRKG